MTAFQQQLTAIGTALLLIQKLPPSTVYGLHCTNDDDSESPTVLNIYIAEDEWLYMQSLLGFSAPTDRSTHDGDQYVSFRRGTLLVSFIHEEK